jgi:hypothetical protein
MLIKQKILFLTFLITLIAGTLQAGEKNFFKKIEWHSYAHLRFSTNFDDNYNFSLRRLKFWVNSSPDLSEHWSFKVQAIIMSIQNQKFFLQDVMVQYRWKNQSIRFGQFIPRFSLQRFQPDFKIPSMERSKCVNMLIPDGTILGARDIGAQYNLKAMDDRLMFNIGMFNGYGIRNYRINNNGIMLTQNLSFTQEISNSSLQVGFSTMYRKAENLFLPGILPSDTVKYSGNEFHFVVYSLLEMKWFNLQTEYTNAFFKNHSAYGYYVLLTAKINKKNQAYFFYDEYDSGYTSHIDGRWYYVGYNYKFKGYKMMLSMETGFSRSDSKWHNLTRLQFQIFFH